MTYWPSWVTAALIAELRGDASALTGLLLSSTSIFFTDTLSAAAAAAAADDDDDADVTLSFS